MTESNDSLTLVSEKRLRELLKLEKELKAAREVVMQARVLRIYCIGVDASTTLNMVARFDAANQLYEKAVEGAE